MLQRAGVTGELGLAQSPAALAFRRNGRVRFPFLGNSNNRAGWLAHVWLVFFPAGVTQPAAKTLRHSCSFAASDCSVIDGAQKLPRTLMEVVIRQHPSALEGAEGGAVGQGPVPGASVRAPWGRAILSTHSLFFPEGLLRWRCRTPLGLSGGLEAAGASPWRSCRCRERASV